MLALLATGMMAGSDLPAGRHGAARQGRGETLGVGAGFKPAPTADDQGRTPAAPFDLQLLRADPDVWMPSVVATLAALPADKGDAVLDHPRPSAGATSFGQTGTPDGAVVERQARITFYSCLGPRGGFCGAMSSGKTVYEGAAACGSAYALSERVSIAGDPTGRVYVCEDRGWLTSTQVDVFWYREEDGRSWTTRVGRWADVSRQIGMTPAEVHNAVDGGWAHEE